MVSTTVHKRLALASDAPDEQTLSIANETLRGGGLVVYPTDTLYGIGADPFNERALARLQSAKRRAEQKPILLITHSPDAASEVVESFSTAALVLAGEFWPGPLTLVLPARAGLARAITQDSGTVGLRIPANKTSLLLAELFGKPITSTSANLTGESTPGSVDAIEEMLGDAIDLYLDAGPLPPSRPSTIVDVTVRPPRILREGALTRDQLLSVLPDIR